MATIKRGDRVLALSATNKWYRRRALSGVVQGMDFPVVWVCREEDWEKDPPAAPGEISFPWPAEDVRLRDEA